MNRTGSSILLAIALIQAPFGVAGDRSAALERETSSMDGALAQASRWYVRVGPVGAFYHPSAKIATSGHLIPGATATVSNNESVTLDIGYDVSGHFSTMLMVGGPPKPIVTGAGSVAALGDLGRVRYGPAILTGCYRFGRADRRGGFRPYAGMGAAYAIILQEFDGAVSDLEVHNDWGFVLQAGMDYELGRKWDLFIDFKRVWLGIDADGMLAPGVPVTARVTLDPNLISIGAKFRFR